MAQFGSSRGITAQSVAGVLADNGDTIVNPSTQFGNSPLGIAPISQALYGIANPTFDNLPPDPFAAIKDSVNPLPYWSISNSSSDAIDINMSYDDTTKTYSVLIDPAGAVIGDYVTLTTRSFITTDDNLALRQKALAILQKIGTYSGTTQFNLALTATVYDHNDVVLTTYTVGTVYDNTTWTSISGFTTTGVTTVNASAEYVDLSFVLTVTATVTSGVSVKIKSLILSSKIGASGSFVVTETFTSSSTWTVPPGVTSLIAVVGVGAGGGGGGGPFANTTAGPSACGGAGGGASPWVILRDLTLGTATSVSVGIGAGGVGGTAAGAGTGSSNVLLQGGIGAAGGATTFGSFLTITGGGAGAAGTVTTTGTAVAVSGGTAGQSTAVYYNTGIVAGTAGGNSGAGGTAVGARDGVAGGAVGASDRLIYPYLTFSGSANSAGSATMAGWNLPSASRAVVAGTAGISASGTAGFGGSGGGGAGARQSGSGTASLFVGNGGNTGAWGSGGAGGAAVAGSVASSQLSTAYTTRAGDGGSAGANSGCGGGGGGALLLNAVGSDSIKLGGTAGAGGAGAGGCIVLVYAG